MNRDDGQLDRLTVKYLEPGHTFMGLHGVTRGYKGLQGVTFMSADSFHHKAEVSIKNVLIIHIVVSYRVNPSLSLQRYQEVASLFIMVTLT